VVNPEIPPRISRLEELANNLWWSWHPQARNVFRTLDYQLWKLGGHNPVRELQEIRPETLQTAANDPSFLALYDSVMSTFDADMSDSNTWFTGHYPGLTDSSLAYCNSDTWLSHQKSAISTRQQVQATERR